MADAVLADAVDVARDAAIDIAEDAAAVGQHLGVSEYSERAATHTFECLLPGYRGWVWTEAEHSSIKEWKVTSEVADDGVTHTATHLHVTDKRGRVHELDAEVFRVSPGPAGIRPNATIVNEGLARWTYEGRTGHGISEYLHQLDSKAQPVVPIE